MAAEALILRFDAPLVSFGGVAVDQHGVVDPFPALSLITGLLANALGYRHGDFELLEQLQDRLRMAARCDVPGEPIVDFQTVDLGQDHMAHGWTTWGRLETRKGASGQETHIRYRHYRADSVHTVAIMLDPADEAPTSYDVEAALLEPARPLFIGRKCCLPSGPIFAGRCEAESPIEALRRWPRLPDQRPGPRSGGPLSAWWEAEDGATVDEADRRLVPVTDRRDWANQVHCGRRLLWHGPIDPPEAS